jgi:DNA polymerase-3 subunit delta'
VLLTQARAAYTAADFEPADAAAALVEASRERGAEAKELEDVKVRGLDLPAREAEQRVRRAQRGAEREELLAQLEELASWYRDLVVVGVGAEAAATHVDMLEELRGDATRERLLGAERAAEAVRETWRKLEEFNLSPQLALEALFVEVSRELAA